VPGVGPLVTPVPVGDADGAVPGLLVSAALPGGQSVMGYMSPGGGGTLQFSSCCTGVVTAHSSCTVKLRSGPDQNAWLLPSMQRPVGDVA
jgi:hypothetical protein